MRSPRRDVVDAHGVLVFCHRLPELAMSHNPVAPIDAQRLNETVLAFAVESMDHAVLILDATGEITWCNEAALGILNAGESGLVGRNVAEIFVASDVALGIPQHELVEARSKKSAPDDRWLRRLDDTRFWASGVALHLSGEDERCRFVKVFRDLTDAKMQFESLKEACRATKAESQSKSLAIATLAHELRNPLSGVSLASSVVQLLAQDDERMTASIAMIQQNVAMASALIEDLLQHSRIESTGFAIERGDCDLHELLQECIEIASHQAGDPGRVEPLLLPQGRLHAHIDRRRMQQVFVNLIANAVRYTDAPGKIWISGTREGDEFVVRITDEGVGIAPEKLESLFHVFTLPGIEASRLGLGLGLMIVKKIVEAHGGTVQAKSDGAGRGSQFTVRFPSGLP